MLVYISGFLISCMIIGKTESWSHKSVGYAFWTCVALAIPCLIAGLRADTIGTDVLGYTKPLYQLAESNVSLFDYYDAHWWRDWRNAGPADFEPGFSVLVWLATRVFGSFPAVLFVIQLFTVMPIFCALTRMRDKAPVWLGMLVYYFMYFNSSLNLMRQWIAMAILLYAYRFLVERRIRRYLAMVVVAMLFHKSALMGVAVLALQVFLVYTGKRKFWRVVAIAGVGVAALSFAGYAASFLYAHGFYQYAGYLGNVSFSLNQLILRLPPLLVLLACWRRMGERGECAAFFVAAAVLDIVAAQLGTASEQATRIALYFGGYLVLSLPHALASVRSLSNRLALGMLTLGYLAAYWVVIYSMLGSSETVPYVSILS